MPSRDVTADVSYFTEVLGGRLVFAVEGMGTRVAMVELTDGPPRVLLAGHAIYQRSRPEVEEHFAGRRDF